MWLELELEMLTVNCKTNQSSQTFCEQENKPFFVLFTFAKIVIDEAQFHTLHITALKKISCLIFH